MNIITSKYSGGNGNVLFQISATISYSNKLNRPFVLSSNKSFPNIEKYSASSIGLNETEFTNSLKELHENEIFNEDVFPENENLILVGFFQNYKLFDEYKYQIFDIIGIQSIRNSVIPIIKSDAFESRKLFIKNSEIPEPIINVETKELYITKIEPDRSFVKKSKNEITISLHIRRGDYENLECYHLLLDGHYYKRALLHLLSKFNGLFEFKILCFYEKKSKTSANQIINSLISDKYFVQYNLEYFHFNDILDELKLEISDTEEMAIMSQCNHHIIANSTFSWWSAYINPDKNKIVCYPNEFFNHQLYYLNNGGLDVDEWHSIQAWNPLKYKCNCHFW